MGDNSQMNIRDMMILSVLNFIPVKMVSQKVNFTDKYKLGGIIHIACVPSVFLVSSVTVYLTHGISKIATCCCM